MIAFSSRRRAGRQAAERIYSASVRAARRPAFYVDHGVPDTLQGRFEMIALHLFPVLHRLLHEPGDDPELSRLVSEHLVSDMDGAFREMGVGDTTVPKRMKAFYGSFAGRVGAYRRAFTEGKAAVAAALARNIFPDGAEDRHTLALSAYLAAAVEALRAADLDALRRGEVPFPEIAEEEASGR